MFEYCGDSNEIVSKKTKLFIKGIEIAVKYSENWQYHVEMEIMIDEISKKDLAERQIKKIATELDIKLMSDEEIKEHVKRIESNLN